MTRRTGPPQTSKAGRTWRRDAAEGRLREASTVRFRRVFTERDLRAFGRLTRDYNPVHYELRFARHKGFPRRICHGMLVGSMVCEPGGQWAWLASGMSFRFLRPVYVGDAVTCELTIRELDAHGRARAEAVFTNQRGETVMRGELTGRLPVGDDRCLLRRMLEQGDPTNPLGDGHRQTRRRGERSPAATGGSRVRRPARRRGTSRTSAAR